MAAGYRVHVTHVGAMPPYAGLTSGFGDLSYIPMGRFKHRLGGKPRPKKARKIFDTVGWAKNSQKRRRYDFDHGCLAEYFGPFISNGLIRQSLPPLFTHDTASSLTSSPTGKPKGRPICLEIKSFRHKDHCFEHSVHGSN